MELKGEALKKIQEKFSKVLVIITNEYLMVSLDLLGKIDSRMRQAKGTRNMTFKGVSVVLVGNQGQLLSVGGTPPYGKSENHFVYKQNWLILHSRRL